MAPIKCGSDCLRRSSFQTTRCPRPDVAERLFQAMTLGYGAAGGVDEDAIIAGLFQGIVLERGVCPLCL